MLELGRRVAVQDPVSVLTPAHRAGPREPANGGRDRLALGSNEIGQTLVAEWQRHDNAVGVDAAPALGKVPQRQQEAIFDALMVSDRQGDRTDTVNPIGPAGEARARSVPRTQRSA